MYKKFLKNILIGLGAVLFFLGLSYGFVPQVLSNKVVNQTDISGYYGMSNEMSEWNKAHPDDPTYWTDAMFGGMPTAAISTKNGGDATAAIYDLLMKGKRPATYLFIALLGSFLLMLSLGVSWPLAIGGAVAIAFCSYNFQIIQVGHNTKMQAIAFFPWVMAALVYTYRSTESKRRWLAKVIIGAVLFGLALSMQVKANHQQITYYLAILVMLYALVFFIDILVRKEKDSLTTKTARKTRISRFFIASALLLVVGLVGIATNVNKLLPVAKYTPNTMRGGSELTQDAAVKGKSESKSTGKSRRGLDLEYATAWSYGWNELPNLLIPNFNGGASSQPMDPQRRRVVAADGPGQVRDRQAPQASRPDGDARNREGPAPVLGAAALYGRTDVHGRHHRVPVRSGPVPVQGEGQVVDHRSHGARHPDGGGQPFYGFYEALLQDFAAVQQVPNSVDGARHPAGDAARAGLPHPGPDRQGRL